MSHVIDYYFAPVSPWAYLGHARFGAIAKAAGAAVRVRPVHINAVFAVSGGLPLARRPAQRQAYRLVELRRFSRQLGVPMNLTPRHFPVPPELAAKLIVATALHDGDEAALRLAGAVFAAVWAQERDISKPTVLSELLAECGLRAELAVLAQQQAVDAQLDENTRLAIEAQVFGSPSYVLDGEIFWGQDRLDFLREALAA
jgi:2-hydroxychromene-2-carboxylate isomerase